MITEVDAEVKVERRKRRKKRKRGKIILYFKIVFFAIMVAILIWCVYALLFESKLIKDRRDTGQLISKIKINDLSFQAKTTT
jgi:cell division protein FtsL